MKVEHRGLVLVICAPSGTGKSTLIRRLRKEFPGFAFSVSYTTRAPRSGETPGREYHFVSREEFLRLREEKFFAEWAEVHGNLYGTPQQATLDLVAQGKDVIFDIDVQGARQLKTSLPEGVGVFLLPPSREELERRLSGRGTDDAETMRRRMTNAAGEIAQAEFFDYWIVNDDLDAAYEALRSIFQAERHRPGRTPRLVDTILAKWNR